LDGKCEERLRDRGWFSLGQRKLEGSGGAADSSPPAPVGRISRMTEPDSSQWCMAGG